MFRVFYDNNGDVIYISNPSENEPIDSQYNWGDVENIPQRDMYRQILKVKDGKLIVEDLELSATQEAEIVRIETQVEINEYKQYLEQTDYVTNKLSEVIARTIISGSNEELIIFNAKYQDVLANRQNAREKIDLLEQTLV